MLFVGGCGYCHVGITSSPPALMTLCIAVAKTCYEEKHGTEFLERRVSVGSKQIRERVQYDIDDVNHGQRS
jgi:hypothetical protein